MKMFRDRYKIEFVKRQKGKSWYCAKWKPWYGLSWRLIEEGEWKDGGTPSYWDDYYSYTIRPLAGCRALIEEHKLGRAYVGV